MDQPKPKFKQYRRKQIAELANWYPGFDMTGVSVSDFDKGNGSPKEGDKIARNPANHSDRWLVAAEYFAANFSELENISASDLETEKQKQVSEFFGDDLPVFVQGPPTQELVELVTAERCSQLLEALVEARRLVERYRPAAERYSWLIKNHSKQVWNHALNVEEKEGHDFIDQVIDAAIEREKSNDNNS